jgi:hypothetical protein
VNAEFNVWLLIVGLVVGAGLVWLVIMDSRRRESEVEDVERRSEAVWLSAVLDEDGFDVSPEAAERLLVLHRAYLEAPPPDGALGGIRSPGRAMDGLDVPDLAADESSVAADEDRLSVQGGR